MIVDSSAIMAILRKETDAERYMGAFAGDDALSMSTGTWIELAAVTIRGGEIALRDQADQLIADAEIALVPVSVEQARLARSAYRDYGRGTGHSARLNFGDCFAYALAKATGEPLLFKGRDFAETDVVPAI